MRKLWLISLGGSSVLSWDFCLGLESELLSGFLLDFLAWFCWSRRLTGSHWLPCNLRFLIVNHLPQFTPKVYVHMVHGPWIWNYHFGCTTSWTKTCKVYKHGLKKGCQVLFTNATRNPEIFPNSFFGFIFTRPINMDLDPLFPQNPLNKNEETNLIYYSEMIGFYIRFWNDTS